MIICWMCLKCCARPGRGRLARAIPATLLASHGLPAERFACIAVGDRFELGPFLVEVFPARHTRTPLDRWINGPLPARLAEGRLPLRLIDYRMDDCFSFRIHADGKTFLAGNHPVAADVLLIAPFHSPAALAEILDRGGAEDRGTHPLG